MWNKLTHLVKQRNTEVEGGNSDEQTQPNDHDASVMSRVYEQHPNLSVFHSGSAINLAASPPVSPSKGSRRSMFKRSLKAKLTSTPAAQANGTTQEDMLSPASSIWTSPSPAKLVPKKLRASLQVDTFIAQTSSTQVSNTAPVPNSAPLPSQPHTPTVAEQYPSNPLSEAQPTDTGSIRSILRDRNTPGTGQSVRFFSRDAYRIISPDVSEDIDQDPIPQMNSEAFLEKLGRISPERSADNSAKYHSAHESPPDNVVDMFSPPRDTSSKFRKPLPFQPRHPPRTHNMSGGSSRSSHSRSDSGSLSSSNSQSLSSLTIPMPPADMSNLFDVSQELAIPISVEGSLVDDAIEEVENENENEVEPEKKAPGVIGDTSMQTIRRSSGHISFPASTSTPNHGRIPPLPRTILSPEGTVFHSLANSSTPEGYTMFHSFAGTNNERTSATIFFTPDASHTRPTSPPVSESNALVPRPLQPLAIPDTQDIIVHTQEDLVASLREQLSLQHQLASQFEVDLTARDELVSILTTQLQTAEAGAEKYRKEVERRQSAMRALRRKVGELEKICRGLEEEVERSREESFDRSIMDEASEGALVVLHGSIGQLKGELEKAKEDEGKVREERDALKREVEAFGEERQRLEDAEKELKAAVESKTEEIRELESKVAEASQTHSQDQRELESLHADLDQRQEEIAQERERHSLVASQWTDEKAGLISRLETRTSDQDSNLETLQQTLDEKEEEVRMLRAEVEAQWGHAEKADEKIKRLEGEKEGLAKSVEALHAKVEEMGSLWKEGEGKRGELEDELGDAWAAKEEVERERDQLVEDVNFEREHAEGLTKTLQERDSKLDALEQERGYAVDNVVRLEELLRTRDTETAEAQSQIVTREREAEELRGQMGKMKREHARLVDEQGRRLDEIVQREEAVRARMEEAVRRQAEDDVTLGSMKERLVALSEEGERLRRQVHELQQESADKEVKLLQLTKARAQDKEDREGLNIALDSKQQELELLKRKMGVKGTGGSTPAPSRVGLPDLGMASRRQSVAFATPSAPRPRPSSVAGIGKTIVSSVETPTERRGLSSSTSTSTSLRTSTSAATVKPTRTAMGPPPTRSTPLSASTSSLARSTSSSMGKSRTGSVSALPVAHRRSSSVMSSAATESEKENAAPVKPAVGRRSTMVPA